MSRAFVREDDRAIQDVLPELELGEVANLVTRRGAEQIADKVSSLEARLASNPDDITRASLARDLRYWFARKSTARIVVAKQGDCVEFGTRVSIDRDGQILTVEIVGQDEANPAEGRINWQSPLAKALLGTEVGETVLLENRQPPAKITVLAVEPL
jgi:transcription elongation GreA/GreB family factor